VEKAWQKEIKGCPTVPTFSKACQKGRRRIRLAEDAVAEEIGRLRVPRSLAISALSWHIHEEIFSVIHWLKEIRPDVVFNLCEGVYGNSCWE